MAADNTIAIKLTLLADGLKQGLANAKQGFENLNQAASAKVANGLTDNLTDKLKLAEAEIKKAIEDLIKLKQAANGKTGALGESLANEIRKAEAEIKKAEAALNKLKAQLNSGTGGNLAASAKKDLQEVSAGAGLANRTLADLKGTIAGVFAVGAVIAFTSKLIEAVKVIQDLRIRLSGLTLTAQDYAVSEAYLVDLSHRHHKSVQELTGSYAAFLAIERSGIITRQQSIQLLEGFSNIASKTGASTTQMGQSIYGLTQTLSSGVVNMQDFRQVVEPLPGIANEIAKAFGLTIGELRDLIASGQLTSDMWAKKLPAAMKAYEGAAARSAGTISASYSDIGNAFVEMAKELEKPIAGGVLAITDIGKATYGWLKDNGDTIVATLGLIAAMMVGKAAAGALAYANSVRDGIRAEQASMAATVKAAEARVATKGAFLETAKAKLADAAASTESVKANLALVQSDLRAEAATIAVANATITRTRAEVAALSVTVQTTSIQYLLRTATLELAAAEQVKAAAIANASVLGKQAAAVTASVTAATQAQIKANHLVVNSAIAHTAAQNTLNAALARGSIAVTRLGLAAKSAMAFVGGPIGAAVIAVYLLFEAVDKLTGAEGKAEAKAKTLAMQLQAIDDSVKNLSAEEVKLETGKAEKNVDELHAKIAKLEEFNLENVLNFSGNAAKRQAMLDDLELAKHKVEALSEKSIELIKNFDSSTVPVEKLSETLKATQGHIDELSAKYKELDDKRLNSGQHLSAEEEKQRVKSMQLLNAYQAMESGLLKRQEQEGAEYIESTNRKAKAARAAHFKELTDEIKESGKSVDAETTRQTEDLKIALDQRKADIALLGISELQKELLVTQAMKASNDAQLLIIKQSSADKIAIINDVFKVQIDKAHAGSQEQKNLDEESLQSKLGIYNAQAKSYAGMINSLVAEEQKLATESLRLSNERKGIEQSYEDFKLGLHQSGLTSEQKNAEDKLALDKLVAAQKQALAKGDVEAAAEFDSKILELGKKIAAEQQKSVDEGKGYQGQVDEILRITDKAQTGLLATNDKAQAANKQRLGEIQSSAEEAKTALASVQTVIDNLNKEMQAKHYLTVEPKTQEVDAAIERIKQPTHSTHTIDVVENHVQAHAGGGAIYALNAYAGGGGVTPPELFPRKQGAISGKGTGTSDEVPAMLSNGEYVVTAEKVKQYGVAAFDDINYGNKSPAQVKIGANPSEPKAFASGGAVGDDKIKAKVDELKKQSYEMAVAVFNDPKTQVVWRMNEGMTTTGSEDPQNQARNFEARISGYLRANHLPPEWRDMYLKGVSAQTVLRTTAASFEDKAKAQVEFEDIQNGLSGEPPVPTTTPTTAAAAPARASFAPAPVLPAPNIASMPSITPANFSPTVSRSGAPTPAANGKVSTVKFVAPDNKSVTGTFSDSNTADFFSQLDTISGVTRV